MSAAEFFAASKVLIVAGKGGVGKTTVGATIGLAAARAGLRTLLIELEGRSNLGAPFGLADLSYGTTEVDVGEPGVAGLFAKRITPDEALVDYLAGQSGLKAISARLARTNAVELITTTAPGIRDLLTLGKIRNLEQENEYDLIVVDAPAAGHTLTFLQTAAGMAASARSGPLREQADQALAMLDDPARTRVMLVTLPEETPVTELVETALILEDKVGVHLAPVVVNGVWPVIDGLEVVADGPGGGSAGSKATKKLSSAKVNQRDAAVYRLARQEAQQLEIDRLASELPVPQIILPFLFATTIDRTAIDTLAAAFSAGAELVEGARR